jgi:CRISPR-associated helicase Cas3
VPKAFQEEKRRVRLRPWAGGARETDDPEAFYARFGLKPTPFQRKVFEVAQGRPAHLLLAPTGTGKTEAAAFPALARGERLVFVLPTRSLVDDLEGRFRRYLKILAQEEGRPKVLVVDTGHRQVRFRLGADGREEAAKERHLYHADVILTTLDKLLYRYFGYAEGVKSYTFPRRIHDRRTLFVFDEVHLYEATAWVNFRHLIASLYKAGVRFLVMSATMPGTYREELLLEGTLEHPPAKRPSRVLHYMPHGKPTEIIQEVIQSHRGKRVLVVLEEVKEVAELYKRLKGEGVFLYHGRLAEGQRRRVFEEVKRRDEAQKPYLLITTSAIEVGVDLDADKVRGLNRGHLPFYEPHLGEMLEVVRGRVAFTDAYREAVPQAEVVFLAVGTPSLPDGSPDLSQVREAAQAIGRHLGEGFTVVVNKSTVPVGSGNYVEALVRRAFREAHGGEPDGRLAVASNPEFLREGQALHDSLYPDRIERRLIRLDADRATVVLPVNGLAQAVELDPDFRLWRRLDPAVLPPILREVFIAPQAGLVLADAEAAWQAAARQLASRVLDHAPRTLEAQETPPADLPLLILGSPAAVERTLIRLGLPTPPARLQGQGTAQVWAGRDANGRPYAVARADSAESLSALQRALPHYGRQSWLSFEAGRVRDKGVWPARAERIPVTQRGG